MIDVKGLVKQFGSIRAVDGVTFHVEEGEIFGLLGPNGAGKTTMVRVLCCLLAPTSGSATVAGYDILREPEKVRENVGLLPEVHGHYERLTGYENLEFYGQLYDLPEPGLHRRIKGLLDTVGLWDRRNDKVGTYSRGMRQKLAIARAIIHDPPVLFLDEPTSALDPASQRRIRNDILALSKKRERTVLICTHNLAEAEMLCDRTAIINHGKIVAIGETEKLGRKLSHLETFELTLTIVTDGTIEAVKSSGVCSEIEVYKNKIRFKVANPERNNPIVVDAVVKAGGRIMSLSEVKRTLEDIYLEIMGERP
ncbi:MAG: ATP-binding cassette domain-containing protein [Candidatus Bathyarchaeia archaeon]